MAYWICASAGQVTNRRSEKKTLHLNTLTVPRKNLVMISSPPVFIHNKAGLENLDRQGYKMYCGHSRSVTLLHSPSFLQCLSLSYITRLEVRPLLRTCLVACLVACMFRSVGQVIGRDVHRSLHQYVHPFVNLLIGTCCPHARLQSPA